MKREVRILKPKGVTYVEMMICVALISTVFIFLAYVTILQARQADRIYNTTKAERNVRLASEMIRFSLVMGRFGTVAIQDNGHTLRFNDPNMNSPTLGNNVSFFRFIGHSLYYSFGYSTDPTTQTVYRQISGLEDVTFTAIQNAAQVQVTIKAKASVYQKPDVPIERTVSVFLRN